MKHTAKAVSPFSALMTICFAALACSAQDAGREQQGGARVPGQGIVRAISDMTTRRAAHTATLLDNGKVLVTGGFAGNGPSFSSTELFDPATARFSRAPSMSAARASHTATRLPDGKVLVAGGYNGDYLSSAEVFDPATKRFELVGPMTMARSGHSATLLKSGKILITGGTGTGWTFLSQAELFDPRTRTFEATGGMRTARESHTATILADGKVFVAGGHRGRRPSVTIHSSAEIYDPATGTFAPAGKMTRVRHKHEAALLQDGRVLIAGGSDERDARGAYVSAEIYDPRTGVFTATGDMNLARYKFQGTLVALRDGKVLLAGGAARAEIFDPATNAFSLVPGSLGRNRFFATATVLQDGRVLITGGYDDSNAASTLAWIYKNPSDLPVPLDGGASAPLKR
jgi:hypothetical protein